MLCKACRSLQLTQLLRDGAQRDFLIRVEEILDRSALVEGGQQACLITRTVEGVRDFSVVVMKYKPNILKFLTLMREILNICITVRLATLQNEATNLANLNAELTTGLSLSLYPSTQLNRLDVFASLWIEYRNRH